MEIRIHACPLAILGTDLRVVWKLLSVSTNEGNPVRTPTDDDSLAAFENKTFAVIQPDRLNLSGAVYEVEATVSYQPNENPADTSKYLFRIQTEQASLRISFCLEEMNITQSKRVIQGERPRQALSSSSSSIHHIAHPPPGKSPSPGDQALQNSRAI